MDITVNRQWAHWLMQMILEQSFTFDLAIKQKFRVGKHKKCHQVFFFAYYGSSN